jgi:site-specific DNA-cytosine methylase
MTALVDRELEYKVVHLCAGIGFGALGFQRGHARIGRVSARFRTLCGIDVDPVACADFERIVGAPCPVIDLFSREQYAAWHGHAPPDDWREATADDLRQAAGGESPDVLFWSPPCKGLSSLLNSAAAASPRYQALNELVVRVLDLALEAWADSPPSMVLLENVPRLAARGRPLLDRVKLSLDLAGYASAETTHDCGELGGLAQHRQRFLLVARHRAKIRPFLYEPDRKPVRGVGEVVGGLPMPGAAAGGPMHALPKLRWKTWTRLALIEAGSDWRSLNQLEVVDGIVRGLRLQEAPGPVLPLVDPRPDRDLQSYQPYGVIGWDEVGRTVTGQAAVGAGPYTVADPRIAGRQPFNDTWRVIRWDGAAQAVTSGATPSAGGQSIADPRVGSKTEGADWSSSRHYGVLRWDEVSPTVTGHGSYDNGAHSVADPRGPNEHCEPWIWSLDGTRHRPFTTLEFAALQGYPVEDVLGLRLGGAGASQREHIGNAVPVAAAEAIASTMLQTLLMASAGQSFSLSASPIWVDRRLALGLSVEAP